MHPRRLLALVAATVAVAACAFDARARPEVRSDFVRDATCPADRVTVAQASAPAPPPDVAADPGRLAVWNDQPRQHHEYVARGCGQELRYACWPVSGTEPPYPYDCVRE
ncbi:MAG TPA: hypothetical protein VGF94_24070 [Kofleriaceae bacterium]|jgi:hypothetical protein